MAGKKRNSASNNALGGNTSDFERPLSVRQRVRYGFETALAFAILGFFRLLGVKRASATGGWLGRKLIRRLDKTPTVAKNMDRVFPQMKAGEREKFIDRMWENFGRSMGEYVHFDAYAGEKGSRRLTINGREHLMAAANRGKGVIVVCGHLANIEIVAIGLRRAGMNGAVMVRHPSNPFVAKWLAGKRSKYGLAEQISRGSGGTMGMFNALRRGKTVMIAVDQAVMEGIVAPFFGYDAMTTPAPAALALKMGVPIVPVGVRRLQDEKFSFTAYPALMLEITGDRDADIMALTTKINAAVEETMAAAPADWLWMHHRWRMPKARRDGQSQP
ncbi:MAG: lysophospholipid acyltransferase family protein [Alphaproteobacteria bacterium]|nr:lysophospholipid acyltransferase family protein [Alphaproteobacteria bacterium]